jgi:hypothetical protein
MDTVLSFQTVSRRSSLRSENQELLLESTCRIAPVLTLQASGRRAFSPGCKHLFVVREHPRSRISIHRCYKGYWTAAVRGQRGRFLGVEDRGYAGY